MDDPTRERLAREVRRKIQNGALLTREELSRRIVDYTLDAIQETHTITPIREPVHGTIYTYTRKKCRCDECRAANRDYSREYRAGLRREAGKNG